MAPQAARPRRAARARPAARNSSRPSAPLYVSKQRYGRAQGHRSRLPHHAPIARELQAAEATALEKVADRIGPELGLLGHGVVAVRLGVPRRAVAVIVSPVVIPPAPLVPGGPIEDLEAQVRVFEADLDELGKGLRLEPDCQPALVDRHLTHIADPEA